MLILSRLTQAKEGLRRAFAATWRWHGLIVALLAFAGSQAAHSAAFSGGRFVEADGWKARITVDCLLKDKVCGSFRYETLACEGDLIYSGETPTGFEFRTELRAGRCLPGCTLQISSDGLPAVVLGTVTCTGVAPHLVLTPPAPLAFGTVVIGATASQSKPRCQAATSSCLRSTASWGREASRRGPSTGTPTRF